VKVEYRRGVSPQVLGDLLPGSVACVLTDPPYGTGTGNAIYGRRHEGAVTSIANDTDLGELEAAAPRLLDVLTTEGVGLFFMAPTQYRAACDVLEAAGWHVWHSLPWHKGAPGISYRTRFAYEDVILATHAGVDPWETRGTIIVPLRHPRVREPVHPNEKPVSLLREFLRWACPSGGLVLDPFAGVASSGLAAHAERCDWIGAECDEQWWPEAERRIAELTNTPHSDAPLNLFNGAA
jgi:hypothetical protein